MPEKTPQQLEQEINQLQHENITTAINTMNADLLRQHKALRYELKAEINAKDSIITLQLEKILNQVLLTNGRVSKLETETSVWRFLQKYPKIAGLLFLGLYAALTWGGVLLALKL